jgi:hypothetical protein
MKKAGATPPFSLAGPAMFWRLFSGKGAPMNKTTKTILIAGVAAVLLAGCGFVGSTPIDPANPPGFLSGIWHGMLAPYTLILRLFLDVKMYAVPNNGWFYDLGYWIGITGSIPFGWLAAIIAVIAHVFFL